MALTKIRDRCDGPVPIVITGLVEMRQGRQSGVGWEEC